MGFINLLKNGYRGKLGETVGQKWKNQLTVRTYQSTNNSKSEAQLDQREHYKTIIEQASLVWPSALNIKAPKGKSMSDFNYYTSILEKVVTGGIYPNKHILVGQYTKQNIFAPYAFLRDGSFWLYVNLPQGNPQDDFKTLAQAILFASNGSTGKADPFDSLLTGTILEKKLKAGVVQTYFPRGYFVETVKTPNDNKNMMATLGRKKGSVIQWGGLIPVTGNIQLTDDKLEDL